MFYLTKDRKDKLTKVLYLLRDSQQSTLKDENWLLSVHELKDIIKKIIWTGFEACEVGGGRFFEIAMLKGRNPFYILNQIQESIHNNDIRKHPLQTQILLRGKNALGFSPVSDSVLQALIEEHQNVGIQTFRIFDALNNINNIPVLEQTNHTQGALAYTVDGDDVKNPIYTPQYYINFAKLLIDKGVKSICIKDMAGQIDSTNLKEIIAGIQKIAPSTPITLHMHSTNEEKTFMVVSSAVELGIDGIELAVSPLSNGASHLDLKEFMSHHHLAQKIQFINQEALFDLQSSLDENFANKNRVDTIIPKDIRIKLASFGVPGGAIPSVINLLKEQFKEQFDNIESNQFSAFIDQYLLIVKRVREDAGRPPLVTPTADIICRQAVFCLSNHRNLKRTENLTLEQFYSTVTPDYCKLILGHYGFIYRYAEVSEAKEIPISKPIDKLISLCSKLKFTDKPYINYWKKNKDGSYKLKVNDEQLPELDYYIDKVIDFIFSTANRIELVGYKKLESMNIAKMLVNRFATIKQLALMLAMPPKGKDDNFIWEHVLFSDFNQNNMKQINEFSKLNQRKIMLSMVEANNSDTSWQNRSSDLTVFFTMEEKFLNEEYSRLSRLIREMNSIQDQIDLFDKQASDNNESWLNQKPRTINRSTNRLWILEKQKEELQRKIDTYQQLDSIYNLKENTIGLDFLNTYVYPTIRTMLKQIKII